MKLHLGCGKRFIPGYFHVDQQNFPHVDHVGDIGCLDFLTKDSVSAIYCCHALEYFDREGAKRVLSEWHRVLRPGAVLRLAVPDFAALVQLYQETGKLDLLLGPLYGRITSGKDWIFHKTCYDSTSLETLLSAAGFREIQHYDWRKTEHASVDDFSQAYFPHMDKSKGRLLSLNMEARKP